MRDPAYGLPRSHSLRRPASRARMPLSPPHLPARASRQGVWMELNLLAQMMPVGETLLYGIFGPSHDPFLDQLRRMPLLLSSSVTVSSARRAPVSRLLVPKSPTLRAAARSADRRCHRPRRRGNLAQGVLCFGTNTLSQNRVSYPHEAPSHRRSAKAEDALELEPH